MISLDDPHALHGLLIMQEHGYKLGKAAKSCRTTVARLTVILDKVRDGQGPRAPFADGTGGMVSEADAPRSPHTRRLVAFRFDWQRHIITAMCADGGAPTGQIEAILDRNGIWSPVADQVASLRLAMQRAGFDYEVADGNTVKARYSICGAGRERALKLIENEWVA